MSAWGIYKDRVDAHGGTKYNAAYIREAAYINRKIVDNLSYHTVDICPSEYGFNIETDMMKAHRITQNVAIINSDNLEEKTIYSLPGDDLELGSLIVWMDNYWLLTERDANTTLYTRGKLLQCNHLLKWITDDHEIIEQWCVVEDGTKLNRMKIRYSLAY